MFLSNQQFEDLKEKNSFIEHAKIHGNYYGTTKESVNEQLEKKFDVLLNIDVQGAAELKKLKQSNDLFTNFLYTIFFTQLSLHNFLCTTFFLQLSLHNISNITALTQGIETMH